MRAAIRNRLTYANVVATIGLVVAVAGGSVAVGQGGSQPAERTLTACYKKSGKAKGDLRLLTRGTRCRRGERRVRWSERGPAGPAGPTGAAGAQGPPGAQGPAGADGAAGTARAHMLQVVSDCAGGPPAPCTPRRSKGISSVTRPFTGIYCITVPGVDAREVPAVASVDTWWTVDPEGNASVSTMAATDSGGAGCPNPLTDYVVVTERQASVAVDKGGGTNNQTVSNLASDSSTVSFSFIVP